MSKHFIDATEFRITGHFNRDEDGEILVSVADIRRAIQMAPAANVVEIPEGYELLPVTQTELRDLISDTAAYMLRLEEATKLGCAINTTAYFSRKELLEKLTAFENEHFTANDQKQYK